MLGFREYEVSIHQGSDDGIYRKRFQRNRDSSLFGTSQKQHPVDVVRKPFQFVLQRLDELSIDLARLLLQSKPQYCQGRFQFMCDLGRKLTKLSKSRL